MRLQYSAVFRESSTMTYQGSKGEAERLIQKLGLTVIYEGSNGYYVFGAPMQALILEHDEESGTLCRKCDPRAYIMNTHPEYQKLTRNRVNALVNQLNQGYVDFDDVCDAD